VGNGQTTIQLPHKAECQPTPFGSLLECRFIAAADCLSPNRMAMHSDKKGIERKEKRGKRGILLIMPLLPPRIPYITLTHNHARLFILPKGINKMIS
jgi:hypothetical protein